MKFSRIEDELESLQICENSNSRLNSFWNSLPEEKRNEIEKVHDYFISNGIIIDVFSILKIPVNIL